MAHHRAVAFTMVVLVTIPIVQLTGGRQVRMMFTCMRELKILGFCTGVSGVVPTCSGIVCAPGTKSLAIQISPSTESGNDAESIV